MKPHGPHRKAALEEAKPGRCCVCDRPFPHVRNEGRRKFTCGDERCQRAWRLLTWRDVYHAAKELKRTLRQAGRALQEKGRTT